jgi:hypothetical protein
MIEEIKKQEERAGKLKEELKKEQRALSKLLEAEKIKRSGGQLDPLGVCQWQALFLATVTWIYTFFGQLV